MNGATEIKNLTKAQCAEIGRFFFNGEKADITIYSQLRGDRTLTKEVAVAAQMYLDFEVTSETTREQLLKEYANRYRSLSMADFERYGLALDSQVNMRAEAYDGVDLDPALQAVNNLLATREGVVVE
jgi:hypothetical protein